MYPHKIEGLQLQESSMKKKRRNYLAFLFGLLLLFLVGCSQKQITASSQRSFEAICDELFRSELSGDALNLHFAIANPDILQLSPKESLFPSYRKQDRVQKNLQTENALDTLQRLDTSTWDASSSLSYDIIISSLEASLAGEQFIYLSEPFSSTHGIQNEYPLLLTEYALRSEDDVKQYLKLLEHTPDYFASLLAFEKERTEAGYPLSTANADGAIAACDSFAGSKDLFIRTFSMRIRPLTEKGVLSAKKAEYYESQNERLVDTVLLPAFTSLGDGILLLKEEDVTQKSLYYQNRGREYYSYLLQENVGTDKDITKLKHVLGKDLKENLTALHSLVSSVDAGQLTEISDPLVSLAPDRILEDLKSRMQDEFPLSSPDDYPYEVNMVDPCLEPYTAPAYYFTPPMDLLTDNHIYINESQTAKGLSLYTTLAHEGFPGHLYQAVTTQKAFEKSGLPMLRGLVSYGGYVEGYATYVELLSYQYAKECACELLSGGEYQSTAADTDVHFATQDPDTSMKDSGTYMQPAPQDLSSLVSTLYDVYYYDRRIKLCLYCLLDIKIHGEGQSREQIASYLADFGIRDVSAADSIYDYILNEPTTYLKYYVGFLEFDECRRLAMQHWGKKYSEAGFHTLILQTGPAPFPVIKKAILSAGDSFCYEPLSLRL